MEALINKNGKINPHALRMLSKNPILREELISKTDWLDTNSDLRRLIVLREGLTLLPTCEWCSNAVRFVKSGSSEKLSNTCSPTCQVQSTLKKGHANRAEDWTENLSVALKNGSAKRGAQKANATKKERGVVPDTSHLHTAEVRQKISQALKSSEKFKGSIGKFWSESSQEDIEARQQKIRSTREAAGDWLPLDKLSAYQSYAREVRKVTRLQPIKTLENFEFRGRGKMHLDHRVSIKTGFDLGIPAEIIGGISNLQFIPESENCSKQHRTELEDLQKLIGLREIQCNET